MRSLAGLRGLPLVSIEEGRELGRVGSLLLDPGALRLAGFTVSADDAKGPVMVVPVEAVGSFGSFALTIAKTGLITPLASNEHYLSLFDQAVVLLGSEVCDTAGKLVGFVKDALMDPATGALLRFRITSDKGFLSPYNAFVPASAVNALEKDRLVIHPDHIVAYQKESRLSATGEEQRKFVPLVTQDAEIAQAVKDRISAEMERVRKELSDFLFQQHAEYFIARERQPLLDAVTGAVREEFEKRIADSVRGAIEEFSNALPSMVRRDAFDAQIGQLRESLEQSVRQALDAAETTARQAADRAAEAAAAHKESALELDRSLRAQFQEHAEESSRAMEQRLAALEHKLDAAPLAQSLQELQVALSQRIESLETRARDLDSDTVARLDRAQSVTREEIAALRSEMETRLQSATDRVARILDAHKRERQETADAMQSILADMETGLKSRIENRFEARLAALESALADSRERDNTHKAVFTTRLDTSSTRIEKTEKSLIAIEQQIRTLSETVNARIQDFQSETAQTISERIGELRDTVDTRTAAITDDLAMQLDQLMETLNARMEALEQSRDTADAFIEKTQQSAGRNLNRIQSIEKTIESMKESMDGGAARMQEQLDQAMLDFDFLKNALMTMQQVQQAALDREESERQTLASGLESRLDDLRATVADIGARDINMIAAFGERLDSLHESFGELQGNGMHALHRLAALEQSFADRMQILEHAATRDDLQALVSRLDELDGLRQTAAELAAVIEAQQEEARKQSSELRAALDERLQSAASDIESLKQQVQSLDIPDQARVAEMIGQAVSAALADFEAQLAGAVTQDEVQSLDTRFRDMLKDKLDALRDLMLGALDGRIEELKSADEAARIENMIGDTVQKNSAALQEQIERAMQLADGAAARAAELAREQAAQIRQDMEAALAGLDERFQTMDAALAEAAEKLAARADSASEERLANIEKHMPDAAEIERRLNALQTAAHGIGDLETRLTRKINDVRESADILSNKIQGLAGADTFAKEQQSIYDAMGQTSERLEAGLARLQEQLDALAAREQASARDALHAVEQAVESKLSDIERKAAAQADKSMKRALTQLASEVKSLAEDLEESTQAQVDQAVSAVNAFQARFLGMSEDLDRFNDLKELVEQAEHLFDARAVKRQIAELRGIMESERRGEDLTPRIEALEKELSWAAHMLEDLSAAPFADAAENLARHGKAIKKLAARLADLESRDSAGANQEIAELREQIKMLATRKPPEDASAALKELAQRMDKFEQQMARVRQAAAAPDPDGAFAQAREILESIEERAAAHYRRIVERMDQALEEKAVDLEQRLASIEQGMESLHAIKNDIIRDSVEPDPVVHQALDEMSRRLKKYETLMEQESAVVSRLAEQVAAAQNMLSRTRESSATHEQIHALAERVQELQSNMERMICEITERPPDTGLAERVHKNILDTLRNRGLREILFPVNDLFEDEHSDGEDLPPEITEEEAAGIFGDRLAKQILGERVLQDILSDTGECIISQGDTVDEDAIRRAKQHGKFLELTLNVEPEEK